jgi:hypothetical protein
MPEILMHKGQIKIDFAIINETTTRVLMLRT